MIEHGLSVATRSVISLLFVAVGSMLLCPALLAQTQTWDNLFNVDLHGGLSVFWNVTDRSNGENDRAAVAHGFKPLTILGTYADYPGNHKEHIGNWLKAQTTINPWNKPAFFERIIRRNIAEVGTTGTFVHDIEIDFEDDAAKVFAVPQVRAASGTADLAAFEEAYFKEWASWFWQPVAWAKEAFPGTRVGLYGPQPFRRDYWGIAGKDAKQIDGTHKNDWRMWRHIDPHVDFYVASIYVFYPAPDSVFYMAANVEENYLRTRALGDKPVYAYEWMRYHEGNPREGMRELDPYLVEAMAVLPYFSGAKGIVLWGYEPQLKPGMGRPYTMLPLYMQTLGRVGTLSQLIGRGRLVFDEPAHVSWNAKHPLVRRVEVGPAECVLMAINPWQADEAVSKVPVTCGGARHEIEMQGRHTTLVHIEGAQATRH
jgi:hypothetical protein